MAKLELEHFPDSDMYLLFEKGMRGRVCYISKRYSKTNNKQLKSFDPKQELEHIIYIDENNLFSYAVQISFNRRI